MKPGSDANVQMVALFQLTALNVSEYCERSRLNQVQILPEAAAPHGFNPSIAACRRSYARPFPGDGGRF